MMKSNSLRDIYDENYIDPEVEEYFDFLDADEQEQTGFLNKARVRQNFKKCGEMLDFFMQYPDLFIDLITPKESHFHLFFFQRVMLRCMT